MRLLERIRGAIREERYDITKHAVDEMAEDELDIVDVETSILNGKIVKTEKDDPRGPRHTVTGRARTARPWWDQPGALQRPADISSSQRTR